MNQQNLKNKIEKFLTGAFRIIKEQKSIPRMNKALNLVYETARIPRSSDAQFGVPVDTGNLRSSIHKKIEVTDSNIIGKVYVDIKQAPYAGWVEFGHHTVNGKWVKARPFMRPSLDLNKEKINQILNNK